MAGLLSGHGWTDRLGPAAWGQFVNETVRMRRDPPQDVLQIGERRYVDELAALDEGVQQRRAARAFKAAGEQPILPAMSTIP
jgi:hypothetical protein